MNAFFSPRFRLGWTLILTGLFFACIGTFFRWRFENQLVRTQLTMDIEDSKTLSDAFGVPQLQLLKAFREKGIRSVAVYDQSLANYRDNGRLSVTPREEAERLFPGANWKDAPPIYRYLVTSTDGKLLAHLRPRLEEQSLVKPRPIVLREANARQGELPFGLLIPASKQLFNDAQLGFDPQQVAIAKAAGLGITLRLSNTLNFTPQRMENVMDDAQEIGAKVVIFSDEEVMGYQTLIATTAREMHKRGLIFTAIEFSKQRGAEEFARSTEGLMARVHSVSGDEAAKAKIDVLVERYTRAAKERNIRVLYIRFLRQAKGDPVDLDPKAPTDAPVQLEQTAFQQNLEFVGKVSKELTTPPPVLQALPFLRPAMEMGIAQPFGDYPRQQFEQLFGASGGKMFRILLSFGTGLGVVGATLLLLNLFFDLSTRARGAWLVAGLLLVGALSLSTGIGAKIMALQAGWTMPVVAMLWGGLPLVWDARRLLGGEPTPGRVALFALKVLIRTTLITLIGGLFVVAFLNHWRYMSKADEFLGEKATQFLPLLVVPFAFLGELFPHRVEETGSASGFALAKARSARALDKPFTSRIALVSVLVVVVGYIWMARFGNDSGMEISSLELRLRATLEKVFLTRPRTKEIMLCNPAFVFAVYFLVRRQKFMALAALVPSTIGQADVLNSMCHIHTPVFYCIWRTVTGLFLGTFLGWVALAMWVKFAATYGNSRGGGAARGGSSLSPETEPGLAAG